MQKFCIAKKSKNLANSSINQYRRSIQNLVSFLGGKSIKEITGEDIQLYLATKMSTGEWTPSYANTIRMYLRSFFNFLTTNDYIDKNPMRSIELIKSEQKRKEILSDKEIVEIRDSCITTKELALFDFLMSTGLRVSEIVNLKISDVDFEKKTVRVYGIKTKKWRTAYLTEKAKKHLIDYINERNDNIDILFLSKRNKKCNKQTIENILKGLANRAKLRKRCTVHVIRRSFATIMLKKTDIVTVSKLLGHSDCKITEKHYLVLLDEDIQAKFNQCA